ncbi:hypothetical protein PUN28_010048 [Cardiocondyla obscurior]|uniref:Uncharacterized protein n=1 Tax=Cardiocondyla obscurior TaxID=286306 RepID=A0AAW2FQ74_9HYME
MPNFLATKYTRVIARYSVSLKFADYLKNARILEDRLWRLSRGYNGTNLSRAGTSVPLHSLSVAIATTGGTRRCNLKVHLFSDNVRKRQRQRHARFIRKILRLKIVYEVDT